MLQLLTLLVMVDVLICRPPASRVPWSYVGTVHLVDLFERQAFGLGDKEVDVKVADDKHAEEDEKNPWADAGRRVK